MQDNFKEIINMSSSKSFSLSLNSFHSSEQLYQDFIKIFYLVRYEKFIGSACNIFKYLDKQMINTAYIFQAKTRLAVLQAALVHIVLYKRKVIVDQLRKRLELLGLLKEISRYPKFYKRFFVRTDRFSAAEMIAKIEFRTSDSQNQEERDIQSYIKTYISSSSSERLKEILVYSTGGYYCQIKRLRQQPLEETIFSTVRAVLRQNVYSSHHTKNSKQHLSVSLILKGKNSMQFN